MDTTGIFCLRARAGMLKQDIAVARFTNFLAVLVIVGATLFSIYLFSRMARLKDATPNAD